MGSGGLHVASRIMGSVARCAYGRCWSTYTTLSLLLVLGADQNLTPDRG